MFATGQTANYFKTYQKLHLVFSFSSIFSLYCQCCLYIFMQWSFAGHDKRFSKQNFTRNICFVLFPLFLNFSVSSSGALDSGVLLFLSNTVSLSVYLLVQCLLFFLAFLCSFSSFLFLCCSPSLPTFTFSRRCHRKGET